MKRLSNILLVLLFLFVCSILNAQVISGKVGVFRDSIYVNGRWYKNFSGGGGNDSVFNNIYLPNTTTQYNGVVFKDGIPFLHNFADTTNLFLGYNAGNFYLSGTNNVGIGEGTLYSNTTGYDNTAVGEEALQFNTTGRDNTAVGMAALNSNTTGIENNAFGVGALVSNTTGNNNSAFGDFALNWNVSGSNNVAIGHFSLLKSNGSGNIGIGLYSLLNNQTGNNNVAIGNNSLFYVSTGNNNVAVGDSAGTFGSGSVNNCVFVGAHARPLSGSDVNEIVIGYNAVGGGSNTTTIGNSNTTSTYINGNGTILNNLYANNAVYSNNQLGYSSLYAKIDSSASSKLFGIDKYFFIIYGTASVTDTLPLMSTTSQFPFSSDRVNGRYQRILYVINATNTSITIVTKDGSKINNMTSLSIPALPSKNAYMFFSDGANWWAY